MLFPFSRAKQLIGLDIGSSAIKLLQLDEAKSGYRLVRFGLKPLSPEMIVDGTVMDAGSVIETIKDLIKEQKVKVKDVAISVSGHSVIVKKITLPTMTEDELEESIKWEAEQYIPFDINDVNIDFHVLGTVDTKEAQAQLSVLLVAAKKDKLNDYMRLVTEAGLNPVVIDVDAFALENMYGVNYEIQEGEVVALINIGASVMNINILKSGSSVFTRDISIGGNRYTEAIQRDLGLSYEDAERAKEGQQAEGVDREALTNIITTVNGEVLAEISRSFDYFKTTTAQEHQSRIDKIMVSGGVAKVNGFVSDLSGKLGVTTEIVNPFRKIEVNPKLFNVEFVQEMAPDAAVGVGLAIRRQGDR
jgi:type IV pilus assembly protein PilM